MASFKRTFPVRWYGDEHKVTIEWKTERDQVAYVQCLIGKKEVVSLWKGCWSTREKQRFDSQHFARLVRCCKDDFKDERHLHAALMPVFSIYFGEEL